MDDTKPLGSLTGRVEPQSTPAREITGHGSSTQDLAGLAMLGEIRDRLEGSVDQIGIESVKDSQVIEHLRRQRPMMGIDRRSFRYRHRR